MTFKDFQTLSDEAQLCVYEECTKTALPTVDCTKWTWGQVKDTQDSIMGSVDYATLLKIVQYETILTEHSDADLVIRFYLAIVNSIKEIFEAEALATHYEPTAKEVVAAQEVGGFEVFGTLPQSLRLVGVLASSLKEVESYPYSIAFAALAYQSRLNDFQKIVTKV